MPWHGGAVRCTVWFGYANGRKCFFVEPHSAADFFGRDRLYGYGDDAERFAFFSKAALEFMARAEWNPQTDPFLPAHYSVDSIERKYKKALRDRFWLRDSDGPVIAFIGRLDEQKGMHLVHHALFYTLAHRGQFILIGDAHYHDGITDHFWHLKHYLSDNPDCHLEIGYRGDLAHLVYSGADLLVVPSMFEPCGLAPLIAMRRGTVPVVRATGGLADTVFDCNHSGRRPAERNGYVFHHTDNQAVESALSRALRLWSTRPAEFAKLVGNCMRADYSWAQPGQEYLDIYQHIRHK